MTNIKPTYEDLEKKLADAEKLISKLRKNKTYRDKNNAIGSEIDVSLLSSKELAEAYIASEQNFKNTVDSSPLGIRVVTEEGILIYANKAALNIFGYPSVEELAAVEKSELYTPESYAAHQERKRKRKLKEYVPGEYEISIKRPDGQIRNLLVYHRGVIWGGEQQFMAMYQDITDQKKAEEALRDSEEKYHALVEHSNDGIVYIQDGIIQYCNSKTLEISGGYTSEEIIGKPFINFVAPEHIKIVSEMYRKRMAGEETPERYELNILSKSGNVVYTEISASLFTYKQKFVDIAIIRDITERKRAEEALRQGEEMFAKAFRSSPDAVSIVTFDEESIIIDTNNAAVKSTGYSFNEMIGHSTKELNLWVNLEDRERMHQLIRKNGRIEKEEYQFRKKSGEIRTWEFSAEPIVIGGRNCIISIQRDITEKKRAEEERRKSEERFHNFFENQNDYCYMISPDGKIMDINSTALKVLGYAKDEILGKPVITTIYAPSSQKRARHLFKEWQKNGALENEELTIITKSGEERTVLLNTSAVRDKEGKIIHSVSIQTDITERQRVETALEKSEDKFAKAFYSSPSLMAISTVEEGRIVEANDIYCQVTGYSREELIGRTTSDLNLWHDPRQRQAVVDALNKEGIVTDFEAQMHSKSGGIQTISLSTSKIMLKNEPCLLTIAVDITERKRAEEALRESEREKAAILNGVSELVTYQDRELKLIWANRTAGESVGISPEKLLGRHCYEIWHNRSEPCVGCPVVESFETGQPHQAEISTPDGRTWFVRGYPVRDENGNITGATEITLEITERKQAEEAQRESETRFRSLFETMAQGVVYYDSEGKIISANPAAERILGLTIDQIIGRKSVDPRWKNIHEDGTDVPGEEHSAMVALRTGESVENVVMGVFNPIVNEYRWILISAVPEFKNNEKSPYRVYTTFTDITERRRAEEALISSEARYRRLFESAKDGILILDAETGKIVDANPFLLDMLGFSLKEIEGKELWEIGMFKDIAANKKSFLKLQDEGYIRYEDLPLETKDGIKRDVEFVSNVYQVNDTRVVQCDIRDITERKRTEEALKESEERYRLLFEKINDAILLTQPDGDILAANPAACRMFGRSEEEICHIGRNGVIDTTDPRLEPALEQRRTTGEFSGELTLVRADGTKFPGDISTKIFYDKDGREKTSMIIRDITERKEMEDQMERDREEIKLIIDSTPILVFYKDLEGRFLRVNKALAESLNIPEEDFVWKTVFDMFSKDIAQGMTDDDNEIFKSGHPKLNIIEQYESAQGLRWVQTDKMPIFDNNKVIGLVGFAQDITERKAAEEALKESEERFNKAFHASPNLMAVLSMDEGRFIDVNAEHTRITGYERPEVIGKTTLELNLWANPEQRKVFYSIINTEGRLKNFESLMRTKSGEIRTLLFSAEKIMLRGTPSLVVVALDITERKEADERINHLNRTLRAIRDVDQLITQEKDRDLLIKSVCDSLVISRSFNSAWIVLLDENQQLLAWAGANMGSGFDTLVELMRQGEMPPCMVKALKQKHVVITEDPHRICQGCPALSENTEIGTMIIRLEIEGKIYGILYTSIPKSLINDKDEISLFTEVAMDIAFALRDIDLVAANQQLIEEQLRMAKLESIGMLAGGIAHDFNNLLTGIMGNIGLVKTYISPSDNTYEMLDEAERAAIRARDLTQQLLTFARGGKPVKKPVNTYELIKESAEFALRGSKAKLVLSLPEDLWQIDADEGQISQVINNLVINADEAMPTGGTLKIHAENEVIKKSIALPLKSGNYVQIDIEDTGMGISPEHLHRIFEPYFTTKQRGSGLGLTTAYSVVRNHGGIMTAESERKKGSTFHIYLPASKRAVKGGKILTALDSGQAGGKVLVMDDEEIIRKMLTNMLGMAGYTVEVSADGVEALEKYQQARKAGDPFNAVIMDLTVPGGMGGKEAVKKILEIDPKAVVIVSSGYATDPIMSDFRKYGFKAVIAKPYSVRQLRESLSSLLTKKKKRR
jgi:PAS domain S-box-containing protein